MLTYMWVMMAWYINHNSVAYCQGVIMNHNRISIPDDKELICTLVDMGINVYSGNDSYQVIKDPLNRHLIVHKPNGYSVGLSGLDGTQYEHVLNGTDFYYYK